MKLTFAYLGFVAFLAGMPACSTSNDAADAASGGSSARGGTGGSAGMGGPVVCPTGKGSPMVHVSAAAGEFCIDAHEATGDEYAAFLAEAQRLPAQPSYCAWNGNYFPDGDVTPVGDRPVGGVDFCDARAYCEWTGKRLCGAIGGGPADFTGPTVLTTSEWYTACSHDGSRIYPYGDTFDSARCNGAPGAASQPLPASQSTCEGGYDGLFDMSGNMGEWEDSCNGNTTGTMDYCRLRGGGFTDTGDLLRCDYVKVEQSRDSRFPSAGIRCCAP